jgi:glutamate-ammonia-ligase adenylyltransferase
VSELSKILSSSVRKKKGERLLKESPSPSLAENHLSRLLEAGGTKAIDKIPPTDLPALLRLLGSSAYLSDVLIRQSKNWSELFLRQIKVRHKNVAEHLVELEPILKASKSIDEFSAGLRRHKQREYVRIGARDLLPSVAMEETVSELTALAEASLEAAYRFSRAEVEKDFGALLLPGKQEPNRFVILGMGKLGGGELNFSSDIDVIFLYEEDEGESSGGRKGKTTPREFFTNIGKRIIHAIGQITEDGLSSVSTSSFVAWEPVDRWFNRRLPLIYYESWGQCWERAALIKARPVAGERKLGAHFLEEIEPFIYRRYLDYTTVDELRHMKMRIENELLTADGKERNIKLGYGGIREIEFFTQAMQLVNGGYEPGIREPNTLRALGQLAQYKFIPARDRAKLSDAYRFLRQVEHKVQIVQEAHAHSIPEGENEERALARPSRLRTHEEAK